MVQTTWAASFKSRRLRHVLQYRRVALPPVKHDKRAMLHPDRAIWAVTLQPAIPHKEDSNTPQAAEQSDTHTHTQNGDYHRASVSVPVSNRFLFITTFSCHLLQLFSRVPRCCFAVRLQKCFAWLQKNPKTLHPSFHLQLFLQTELGETASSCQTLHIHQSAPRRSNIQVMQQSEKKTHFCWEGDLKRLCSPAVMIYDILLSLIGAEPLLILIINHINTSIVCLSPSVSDYLQYQRSILSFRPPCFISPHIQTTWGRRPPSPHPPATLATAMTSTTDFDNAEITQQYSHINTRFDLTDEELDNDNSSARLFERSRIKALAGECLHSKQAVSSPRHSCDGSLRWQCLFKKKKKGIADEL